MKYSAFALARHALSGHEHWPRAWRAPEPRKSYDVVIIGGGGHGLATAYYLAKNHGIRNVAVLEKGYIGSGNVGRNTTLIRSNYMIDGNTAFFEHSLKLWEGLSHDLNFNCMVSQRGQIVLAHQPGAARRLRAARQHHAAERHRRRTARPRRGDEAAALSRLFQGRALAHLGRASCSGAPARCATTPWPGAMRAPPSQLGVDIIENCEVTGFVIEDGQVVGVETTRGRILAGKIGIAVAGHTSHVAAHGRPAAAGREPHPAGLRDRAGQAHGGSRACPGAPSSSISRSPTRAGWSSAAISTASTPIPSAASSRRSRRWPNARCR